MFITIKGMKYFNLHIYLEFFEEYYNLMINTFLTYVGMYQNHFNTHENIITTI